MKLENRRQKVVPVSKFLLRLGKYVGLALGIIGVSVIAGTIGYRFIGNLSWIDSFYMASMILTGMGPVVNMNSNTAKVFSSLYALYSGIAFLSITSLILAPIIHRLLHILHVEDEPDESKG